MVLLLCDHAIGFAHESLNRAASILKLPRDARKSFVAMKVIGLSYAQRVLRPGFVAVTRRLQADGDDRLRSENGTDDATRNIAWGKTLGAGRTNTGATARGLALQISLLRLS